MMQKDRVVSWVIKLHEATGPTAPEPPGTLKWLITCSVFHIYPAKGFRGQVVSGSWCCCPRKAAAQCYMAEMEFPQGGKEGLKVMDMPCQPFQTVY